MARDDELHVVIDGDTGRVAAHYSGLGAKEDAQNTVEMAKQRDIGFLKHGTIVTGKDAEKAMREGRL